MNWSEPLDLKQVPGYFENFEVETAFDAIPDNLCIVGIISGYRVVQKNSDFKEIYFDVSQGHDDELRLRYIGNKASCELQQKTLIFRDS